jgi:hypothetical protein
MSRARSTGREGSRAGRDGAFGKRRDEKVKSEEEQPSANGDPSKCEVSTCREDSLITGFDED